MKSTSIAPELLAALKSLRLGKLADTLPDRLALAQKQGMSFEDTLVMVLSDEVQRRANSAVQNRIQKARLDPDMTIRRFDTTAKIVYSKKLLDHLLTLRFILAHQNVSILGPVGVGKSFIANAIGCVACECGYQVRMIRSDEMLRTLRGSRLDNSRGVLMAELTTIDLLIIDDFALESMSREESKDVYQLFVERTGRASTIVTSNRDTSEWLGMFDDLLLAQSAIDRFMNGSHDLIIEGESYRPRLKPKPDLEDAPAGPPVPKPRPVGHSRRTSRQR